MISVAATALAYAVVEYLLNKKKNHVFVVLIVANIALTVFVKFAKTVLQMKFTLVTGDSMESIEELVIMSLVQAAYTIVFIFGNGPLKVFLDIKEGKTSIKKMMEDYEDERTQMHEKLGVIRKEDGILPTKIGRTSGPTRRTAAGQESDVNELR